MAFESLDRRTKKMRNLWRKMIKRKKRKKLQSILFHLVFFQFPVTFVAISMAYYNFLFIKITAEIWEHSVICFKRHKLSDDQTG